MVLREFARWLDGLGFGSIRVDGPRFLGSWHIAALEQRTKHVMGYRQVVLWTFLDLDPCDSQDEFLQSCEHFGAQSISL